MSLSSKVITLPLLRQLLQATTLNVISAKAGRLAIYNSTHEFDAQVTLHLHALKHAGVSFDDVKNALASAVASANVSVSVSDNGERLHVIAPAIAAGVVAAADVESTISKRVKKQNDTMHFRVTVKLPFGNAQRNAMVAALLPVLLADVTNFAELIAYNHAEMTGHRCARLHLLVTQSDKTHLLTTHDTLPLDSTPQVLGVVDTRALAGRLHGQHDPVLE